MNYTGEKTITIKVQDNDGEEYKAIITIIAEQWMNNKDVGLDFIEIIKEHAKCLSFRQGTYHKINTD